MTPNLRQLVRKNIQVLNTRGQDFLKTRGPAVSLTDIPQAVRRRSALARSFSAAATTQAWRSSSVAAAYARCHRCCVTQRCGLFLVEMRLVRTGVPSPVAFGRSYPVPRGEVRQGDSAVQACDGVVTGRAASKPTLLSNELQHPAYRLMVGHGPRGSSVITRMA